MKLTQSVYAGEYFDPEKTLESGQSFRYRRQDKGFSVYSADKACVVYREGDSTIVLSSEEDKKYFENYFEKDCDYGKFVAAAKSCGVPAVSAAAEAGKGIRFLRQNAEETIFSFLLSQNNNIPRIRSIIDKLTLTLGKRKELLGESYYTFPSAAVLAEKDESFFRDLGAGYRAKFLVSAAKRLAEEGTERLSALDTPSLVKELTGFYGIGEKVADCIALFGFGRQECFPVDTWIEKVYRDEFGGTEKDRHKIAAYFRERFGKESGRIQQYLFCYKREKT